MAKKIFQQGEVIFRQGDAAGCMYDIYWGKVGIYADYGTPQERLLTELHDENFFGELGMIDGEPRSATAVALSDDTQVETISEAEFAGYFKEKPLRVLQIMGHMCKRIRELSNTQQTSYEHG